MMVEEDEDEDDDDDRVDADDDDDDGDDDDDDDTLPHLWATNGCFGQKPPPQSIRKPDWLAQKAGNVARSR
eukprot:1197130-Karenia_brevis.AAC.1